MQISSYKSLDLIKICFVFFIKNVLLINDPGLFLIGYFKLILTGMWNSHEMREMRDSHAVMWGENRCPQEHHELLKWFKLKGHPLSVTPSLSHTIEYICPTHAHTYPSIFSNMSFLRTHPVPYTAPPKGIKAAFDPPAVLSSQSAPFMLHVPLLSI